MEKHAVLVGLVGTNLQFSMARQIHMTGGDQNGLRYVYRLIDLADAVAACSFLSTLREDVCGNNFRIRLNKYLRSLRSEWQQSAFISDIKGGKVRPKSGRSYVFATSHLNLSSRALTKECSAIRAHESA